MKIAVTSSVKYTVKVDGVATTTHVQEREAVESALNALLANNAAKVTVLPAGSITVSFMRTD